MKKLLLKTMLLLFALLAGTSMSWADTVTLLYSGSTTTNMTGNNDAASVGLSATEWSVVGSKGSANNFPGLNKAGQIRLYYNASGSNSITVSSLAGATINSITATYGASNNSAVVTVGGNTVTDTNEEDQTGEYDINSSSFTIRNGYTSNVQLYIRSIVINYTPATPAYTITAQSNNNSYGTVSLSGSVIAATPASGYTYADPAYTVSPDGSATVAQEGDNFTVTPSANTTVTINFAAIPAYTVTLSDDTGNPLTEASVGAGVELPSRSDVGSYTFAGWSTTNVDTETTTAPTLVGEAGDTYYPSANITLYPVYSKTEGSGGTQNKSVDVTMSEYATAHSWGSSSSSEQKTVTIDENVTATCNDGTNSGKYYSDWRIYQTETGKVTISTTSGELTSVTFTFTVSNTGTLNYNSDAIASGTAVNVSGTSAEFTVGNSSSATNGQVRITAISVNYTTTGGGTTYYWSAPVAAAVERPEIVVAENPFLFSTTATITCETDGATIKYSYDGETWNNYSSALTITATTTIYAKAVKDENESSIASVTATKNLAEPTVTVSGDLTLDLDGGTNVSAGALTAAVTYENADVAGATVTWSSSNEAVATINASTGAVTIKTRGTVTFTATYAGNSDYAEATGIKTITVIDNKAPGSEGNPYTVAQVIAMRPESTKDPADGQDDVYVKGYIVGSFNTDSKFTTVVPEFQNSNLALADSYNETESSNVIPVQLPSGTVRDNFNVVNHPHYVGVVQVIVKADVLKYFTVPGLKNSEEMSKVAEAVTVGSAGYATWASDSPLDLTTTASLKAYKAAVSGTTVTFTELNQTVPANTGILLEGEATVNIPVVASGVEVTGNDFLVNSAGATFTGDGNYYYFGLVKNTLTFGLFAPNEVAIPANKAYLKVLKSSIDAAGARELNVVFEDATGIESIQNSKSEIQNAVFDLSGRRVSKAVKGIYIVNGKKVVK